MAIVYIALGSNVGNRRKNIKLAIKKISSLKSTKVIRASRFIQTLPIGGPRLQQKFLNAAVKISTSFRPFDLLKKLKKIELCLGRVKTVRNGPRIIDLDILLYEDKVINKKGLTIPHPRMFNRDFVIKPLSEVICN